MYYAVYNDLDNHCHALYDHMREFCPAKFDHACSTLTQSLKQQFEIGQPFLKSRNIALDYQWLLHWKCIVNMA